MGKKGRKLQNSLIFAAQKKRRVEKPPPAVSQKPKSSKPQRQAPPLIPFTKSDKILFVGEGNFSFAASCIENHLEHGEDVLATSLDDEETVHDKYAAAKQHIETIVDCCGRVQYGVDGCKLSHTLRGQSFDVIVFCFPHVAAGIADQDRNIMTNQKMLLGFFESAKAILRKEGTVAVSLALSRTYELWNIKELARSKGLKLLRTGPFIGQAFPGYGTYVDG